MLLRLALKYDGSVPPSGLLGAASISTSLSDFPKTSPITTGNYYVATTGNDSNSGTSLGSPFATISKALSVVSAGQTILVRAGTYNLPARITRNTTWGSTVKVVAYGNERPKINASGLGSGSAGRALYFQAGASKEHWKGFELIGAPEVSIQIEGSYITIEDFWVHDGADNGIYIGNFGGGAGNNLIQDCVVWKLGDGITSNTNVPDCISSTASPGSTTKNNTVVRCVVMNGPDDGIDLFRSEDTQIIDCVSIGAGYYWNGNNAGDGNGFKVGGANAGPNLLIKGSFAIGARYCGVSDNGSPVGYATMRFNTATKSVRGFDNGSAPCYDNIGWDNSTYENYGNYGSSARNSWNLGGTDPEFEGDYSLNTATSPYLTSSATSTPIGASTVALELYQVWENFPDMYNPGA